MYKCLRCGYTNDIKSNFKRHLRRKNACKSKIKDIIIEDVYNFYFDQNIKTITQKPSFLPQINSILPQINSILPQKPSFSCKFCNRCFKRNDNLKRHNVSCKLSKDINDFNNLQKLVKLLNEQLKEQKKELKKELKKEFNKELKKDIQLKEKDKQISELMKKVGVNIGT